MAMADCQICLRLGLEVVRITSNEAKGEDRKWFHLSEDPRALEHQPIPEG